jgi:eukaryotic-like serine/threonine-protein kinase
MALKATTSRTSEVYGQIWCFGDCQFDELSRELKVGGKAVEMESKPLEVLHQLLIHAGEVVTREELLESAWPGVIVVDGSLATAVSKLRKTFSQQEPPIVVTIPRIGYRLGVPVHRKLVGIRRPEEISFRPGDTVRGREQWQLSRELNSSTNGAVWVAEHPKTRETRVFKFALDGVRLNGLKREVTVARLMKESLGERPDFVRVLEWNFETAPFHLETEYCGQNLLEWAESQGGLSRTPFDTRLRFLIEAAQAVEAAHEAGVLHKDLKPANILADPRPGGGWRIKVADFGTGSLLEPARLHAMGITNLGFTKDDASAAAGIAGTLMYMAPEVLAGQLPTTAADVYALGVILYQLSVGDFSKPLSGGWEGGIEDPLIREDIALAVHGDPARRIATVAVLVERLTSLDARRVARIGVEQSKQRTLAIDRQLAASKARRPWVMAAVVILAAGMVLSLYLYRNASQERERANRQTAIAASVNQFLANDLLGRTDPFQNAKSSIGLADLLKQASPDIDREFGAAPEIAARLHQALARAFDNRSGFPDARHEYDRAQALFAQAGGPDSIEASTVRLQLASMEARSYETGSLARAKEILAGEEPRIARLAAPSPELLVWLSSARGMVALIGNEAKTAVEQFGAALDQARKLPSFDTGARLTFQQRMAFAYIRLGDGAAAERLFRELIPAFTAINGAGSPAVLRVRLNLAQAFMVQGKNREAIEETTSIYPAYVDRLGADHELSMQVLTTRAQSEGSLELWDDAIRDDLAIHELALRKQGPQSFFAVATLSDAALAQCRAGRYADGEPNARRSWEASARAFGARAGLTGGAAYTLASCLIGTGKLPEAGTLLRNIDVKAVAQLAGFPDWFANVDLAQAEIAWGKGDYAGARRYVDSAAPVFARKDAEPFQKRAVEKISAELKAR